MALLVCSSRAATDCCLHRPSRRQPPAAVLRAGALPGAAPLCSGPEPACLYSMSSSCSCRRLLCIACVQTLGTSQDYSLLSAVTQGGAKVFGNVMAIILVDRVGRKKLQLFGGCKCGAAGRVVGAESAGAGGASPAYCQLAAAELPLACRRGRPARDADCGDPDHRGVVWQRGD